MASDKRDGAVLKTESDFTGSSSLAPVCIPDKLYIPQNCSWENEVQPIVQILCKFVNRRVIEVNIVTL